jgi:hypothetical protein
VAGQPPESGHQTQRFAYPLSAQKQTSQPAEVLLMALPRLAVCGGANGGRYRTEAGSRFARLVINVA